MALDGWIKLHRKILDCDIWISDDDEPFDRRSAWIDLLLLANHRDKNIIFDGKPLAVQRGQYVTSVRKLASRWMWGNQKTLKFLRLLESLHMITKESDSRRTLLTIVNYEFYQGTDNTDGTPIDTVSERQSTTNKNIKNDKNIKEILPKGNTKKAEAFRPPTIEEVKTYCSERGNKVDAEKWFDFYSAKGWMIGKNKMKDWKAAVRTWERERKESVKGNGSNGRNGSNSNGLEQGRTETEIPDYQKYGYIQIGPG